MALSFNGTSNGLLISTPPVTSLPITISCWYNITRGSKHFELLATLDDATAGGPLFDQERCRLVIDGSGSDWKVQAISWGQSGAYSQAIATAGSSLSTWEHACGVFASSSDRRAFLNGGNKGTNTATNLPSTPTRFLIGKDAWSGGTDYLFGNLAEVAVWDVALSDNQVASLGKCISPLFIQPQNLVFYSPIVRNKYDYIQSLTITDDDAPTTAAHPRIIYPSYDQIMRFGGGSTPPVTEAFQAFYKSLMGVGI